MATPGLSARRPYKKIVTKLPRASRQLHLESLASTERK